MIDLSQPAGWLPLAFLFVMGLAILAYVILDGYDLGVGILLGRADPAHRDAMVASIGPFWDANETWLVLGVGVLLTAFPVAHGVVLTALYLPVASMLLGLIVRGVAFDFRVKAEDQHKPWWNRAFWIGSLLTALSQGYMLGLLIVGFERTPANVAFAALIGAALASGYCLLGAGWLIMKSEGPLQLAAVRWARISLWLTALGVAAVSAATPLLSPAIFAKWFSVPEFFLLLPIPVLTVLLFVIVEIALLRLPEQLAQGHERWAWVPFGMTVGIFVLSFHGLAYSLYPWLVPERIDIWHAAAAPGSLMVLFIGVAIVLPLILAYTVFAYRVFWGKTGSLEY